MAMTDDDLRRRFRLKNGVPHWREGEQAPVKADAQGYVRVPSIGRGYRLRTARLTEVLKKRKPRSLASQTIGEIS